MVSFNHSDQANALAATLNNSSLAPTKFKIFASPSLTPQNVRPIVDLPQGITNTGTASRINGNGSLLGHQHRGQVASRNDTMNNSHIQGRKIDSPKIYVKEVNERPKTSAQQARKSSQAPTKKAKAKERPPEKKTNQNLLVLAPQTQKDADTRKFDFKFAQTTKADSQKRDKSKKSGGKKKPNLNKSQVINLCGEKVGHHRTQTIHGGVPNYEVVNLKLQNNTQKQSGNELQAVLPSSVVSPTDPAAQNQYVSWTNEQIKVMTHPQRNSNERRQHQSFQIPKSSNGDSASQLNQDQQLINIQFPLGSKVQAGMKRLVGKNIPTKGSDGFSKVQRKKQHMHNQTMVINRGEYATEVQRAPKTQRSGNALGASSQTVITAPERKRTKSGEKQPEPIKRKVSKGATKSTKSKKDYARNSHSGLHDFEKITVKGSKAHSGIEIQNNKENLQNNSSQIIVSKDSVPRKELKISSASSQSRKGTNETQTAEKLGKLFKNNFFVDGQQLLKHMSPDTPQKNISIQASNDHFSVVVAPQKGHPSTTKTSGTRPQSKNMGGQRHPGEDSGKITLDHESLQCHQKNRLQIMDIEECHSSRKRDSKPKGLLSQQLSQNQDNSPVNKKSSGLD